MHIKDLDHKLNWYDHFQKVRLVGQDWRMHENNDPTDKAIENQIIAEKLTEVPNSDQDHHNPYYPLPFTNELVIPPGSESFEDILKQQQPKVLDPFPEAFEEWRRRHLPPIRPTINDPSTIAKELKEYYGYQDEQWKSYVNSLGAAALHYFSLIMSLGKMENVGQNPIETLNNQKQMINMWMNCVGITETEYPQMISR